MYMKKHLVERKTPHLDFYKSCMITGQLPVGGLCHVAAQRTHIDYKLFYDRMTPTYDNMRKLREENYSTVFWAYGKKKKEKLTTHELMQEAYSFTPLRQTIVLLMAAIKGEL